MGTITDGLKRLTPLFEPVYEALVEHSQGQTLWHADETRWLVFVVREGKAGYRWYLWVFHSAQVVVFVLAAGRSHDVPEEYFGPAEGRGILVVDRYKAYQAIDKVKSGRIVLAFCWAHTIRTQSTIRSVSRGLLVAHPPPHDPAPTAHPGPGMTALLPSGPAG